MSQLKIREMPQDERPRENSLHTARAALSDPELIAILLRTGILVQMQSSWRANCCRLRLAGRIEPMTACTSWHHVRVSVLPKRRN